MVGEALTTEVVFFQLEALDHLSMARRIKNSFRQKCSKWFRRGSFYRFRNPSRVSSRGHSARADEDFSPGDFRSNHFLAGVSAGSVIMHFKAPVSDPIHHQLVHQAGAHLVAHPVLVVSTRSTR